MAKVLIFSVYFVLTLSRADSCFLDDSLSVKVPRTIPPGYEIAKVEVAKCDAKSTRLTSTDSSFSINGKGEIKAVSFVPVSESGRTFSVRAQDSSGLNSEMEVHLVRTAALEEQQRKGEGLLRRFKRRWGPPPFHIIENDKGPFPRDIEKIISDASAKESVYYTLTGPGLNKYPEGVFSFDGNTGQLRLMKSVDREEFPSFELTTRVFSASTRQEVDEELPIIVNVDDENDNAPTFSSPLSFSVPEKSKAGTVVGKVNATDRDQEGTDHVLIRYSLLSNTDLFAINSQTGDITTRTDTLDRQMQDKYLVIVQIKDMDGRANGLSNTGTATITVKDINNHPPTFLKPSYKATIEENQSEKLILKIPVNDEDEVDTPNWISEFIITKGNENGNFRIERDPKTNGGLLYVSKGLNYEKNSNVKLEILARNVANLSGTTAKWNTIPVEVAVIDVDEGPEFTAPILRTTVKENVPNGTLIATYTAVDPETKSSNGINYYKVSDRASWINVDKNTGELRVANTIDRESKYVKDGTYNITMRAVANSKSATGTVVIVVEDVNDNQPTFPSSQELSICEEDGKLGSAVAVAEDPDQSPFSSPFTFTLPKDYEDKWSVTRYNSTAATLTLLKPLPLGEHSVPIQVTDLQGNGKEQTVKVRICKCKNGACLPMENSVTLGPLGILAMLLPLVLLLLLCLLLIFFCVTKREKLELDDGRDSGGILLKSNTEAPGEEVDSSLITGVPIQVDPASKGGSLVNAGWQNNSTSGKINTMENGMYKSGVTTNMREFYSGQYDDQFSFQQNNREFLVGSGVDFDNRYLAQDTGLLHTWQTNGRYLQQKLAFLGTEEDGRYADDIIHGYKFEGVGSAAGSIGCCSDYGDNNDLDFLNTLGPKFKTLADVCTKT